MEQPSTLITLTIFLCLCLSCVNGKTHHHHHHHHNHHHHHHHHHKPRKRQHSSDNNTNNGTDHNPSPSPAAALPPSGGEGYPPPSADNATFFDVKSLGAVGDGVSDDTRAFQMAWDYACEVEDSTIFVPEGYTFMIRSLIFAGPCQKGLHFQIEGVVVPPDGPDSWPSNYSKRQWLVFYRAHGLTLHGRGRIDGRGEKWWNLPCKPHRGVNGTTLSGPCDSPVALRFFTCGNVTVYGLRVENSPQFHFRFDGCRNVIVDNVTINAPAYSPNTDGIHVENTVSVGILNSVISNGDDCVSIGSGSMKVLVDNVTCGPSHGISIGSLGKQKSRACVRKVRVTNTTIKHSDNGARIKTWQGGSGSVSSVAFENIYMDDVRNPIIIDQYYCPSKPCANESGAVLVSDVSYANIWGTYDVRSPPMHFGCSDSVPCTNITLSDIELLPVVGDIVLDPYCWNVYGDAVTLTIPPVTCMLEGLPTMATESEVESC